MRIYPPPLTIGLDEGFDSAKDTFQRVQLGESLTNLVSNVSDPLVVALDGAWGSGKSTFLKMWRGHLRKQGFPVVYFDAFESDYIDDAFAALAGEIVVLLDSLKEPAAKKKFIDKAVAAAKVVGRGAAKVGIKAVTAGALSASEVEKDLAEAVSSEAATAFDEHIGNLITRRAEQRELIDSFRIALKELPSALTKGAQVAGEGPQSPKPLVFIIDELDRCKPSFALAILERIKHFFAVENVHFVLGVHLQQLETSVAAAYGPHIDGRTYLQKFIHFTVPLPLPDLRAGTNKEIAQKYIDYLAGNLGFNLSLQFVNDSLNFLKSYSYQRDISLRALERIVTNFAIILASANTERALCVAPIIMGLCIMRVMHPELYARARNGQLSYEESYRAFGLERDFPPGSDLRFSEWTRGWWKFCCEWDLTEEQRRMYRQNLWNMNIDSARDYLRAVFVQVIDPIRPAEKPTS